MMECRMFKSIYQLPVFLSVALLVVGFVQVQESVAQHTNLAPGMTNAQGEEIVGRASGFSAVLTLDDSNLQALVQQGRVEIAIPHQLINSVDSVIIKRPVHFKNDEASDFADAELSGQRLVINIDNSVIERIDYQPVKLKVYETGFRSVVLNYTGDTSNRKLKLGDSATDSPLLNVKLKSGNGITGRISGMKQLKVDSSLGEIKVAFDRTRCIRVKPNGELAIEMINGDLISGKVEGDSIELVNRWSTETIKLANVEELVVKRPKQQAGQNTKQRRTRMNSSGVSASQTLPQQIYNARGF